MINFLDPDRLYEWQERVAIKMDSGIPQAEAERQSTEEQSCNYLQPSGKVV